MGYVSGWQELYLKLLSRNNLLVFVPSSNSITSGRERETHVKGKFLGTLGVRKNGAPSSNDKHHHKFNEWTLPWMWEKRASFSALSSHLKILATTAFNFTYNLCMICISINFFVFLIYIYIYHHSLIFYLFFGSSI